MTPDVVRARPPVSEFGAVGSRLYLSAIAQGSLARDHFDIR